MVLRFGISLLFKKLKISQRVVFLIIRDLRESSNILVSLKCGWSSSLCELFFIREVLFK